MDPAEEINAFSIRNLRESLSEFFRLNNHHVEISLLNGRMREMLLLSNGDSRYARIRQADSRQFFLDDSVHETGGKSRQSRGYFLGRFPVPFRDNLGVMVSVLGLPVDYVLSESLEFQFPVAQRARESTGLFGINFGEPYGFRPVGCDSSGYACIDSPSGKLVLLVREGAELISGLNGWCRSLRRDIKQRRVVYSA